MSVSTFVFPYIFFARSLGSFVRLYKSNLNVGAEKRVVIFYIAFNLIGIAALALLYLLPSDVFETAKYIGLVVMVIYGLAVYFIMQKRKFLSGSSDGDQ